MARRRSKAKRRKRAEIVAWRRRVGAILDSLEAWARDQYGAAIDAHLAQTAAEGETPQDRRRRVRDFVCAPGSAGDGRSILGNFCESGGLSQEERAQALRWESARRRGVFVVQASNRDRLVVWDPLEGAPLTLHLLERQGGDLAGRIRPGAVATATYLPWMARLVAVEAPEYFLDPRALQLFREQTVASGVAWHEAPAAAPERIK